MTRSTATRRSSRNRRAVSDAVTYRSCGRSRVRRRTSTTWRSAAATGRLAWRSGAARSSTTTAARSAASPCSRTSPSARHAQAALAERTEELSRSNAELVRSNDELAEAQSIASVGSWTVDLVSNVTTCSRELCRLFGFSSDAEPDYRALIERTHPEDRESTIRLIELTMRGGSPFVVEHRLLLPDGSLRWVRARGRVELDAAGTPAACSEPPRTSPTRQVAEDGLAPPGAARSAHRAAEPAACSSTGWTRR